MADQFDESGQPLTPEAARVRKQREDAKKALESGQRFQEAPRVTPPKKGLPLWMMFGQDNKGLTTTQTVSGGRTPAPRPQQPQQAQEHWRNLPTQTGKDGRVYHEVKPTTETPRSIAGQDKEKFANSVNKVPETNANRVPETGSASRTTGNLSKGLAYSGEILKNNRFMLGAVAIQAGGAAIGTTVLETAAQQTFKGTDLGTKSDALAHGAQAGANTALSAGKEFALSMVPGYNTYNDYKQGNYWSAAGNLALDVVTLVPVVGIGARFAVKGGMALGKTAIRMAGQASLGEAGSTALAKGGQALVRGAEALGGTVTSFTEKMASKVPEVLQNGFGRAYNWMVRGSYAYTGASVTQSAYENRQQIADVGKVGYEVGKSQLGFSNDVKGATENVLKNAMTHSGLSSQMANTVMDKAGSRDLAKDLSAVGGSGRVYDALKKLDADNVLNKMDRFGSKGLNFGKGLFGGKNSANTFGLNASPLGPMGF